MAAIYRRLCTITSRIKGDHCYRSNPRINEVCNCIPEPSNAYSRKAIVVKMKNTNGGEQDATTVGPSGGPVQAIAGKANQDDLPRIWPN